MADAARTAPKPTVAVQRETTASKKAAPASPVVAPAVDGRNGLLYAAGPAMRLGVQCKVVVGPPDDPFEQEADRVAERVSAGGPAMPVLRLPRGGWGLGTGGWGLGEAAQRVAVQREAAEEEEEPAQTLAVQRETAEEEEERAQLKAGPFVNGVPRVSAQTTAAIRNPGAGLPITPYVRSRIEPVVGADLGRARIHTGGDANRAATSLHARAFTHRHHIFLGSGESAHDLRLMAHEATHVVQQGAASAWGAPRISRAPDQVQRLPAFIAEELDSYARYIPGYTLFTVIVGYNPLLGESVERNATNLLQGLMGLTPAGTYVFDKLNEYGIIQDAFAWVEGELNRLDLSLERIERTIEAAYEEMDFIRLDPFDYNLAVLRRHFGALYDDVVSFAASLVNRIMEMIKEAVVGVAEGLLADNRAWALLKKVLHYDPLRGESVEATTEEILADFLLLIGKETELAQMQERGTLAETAAWLDTQFATFAGLIAELGGLFSAAWEAIQPENLPDLPTNLQSLVSNVGGFLQRVWDFASTVALKVLELIKKSLLGWLSSFANEVPGFHLVTVILGRNPFTEEAVPRTAENIIRGFITLLPGGNATYQQLAETGTIAQAAARIEGAMAELGISWELITGIFTGIWNGLTIDDLLDPIGAFTRIVDQFGEPISRLFAFIRVVLRELFMLILQLMNFPSDLIGSIISNAMQAFESIKNDPVGFFKNMLAAVKQGFSQFFDNILQHLLGGLVDWLFRGLREAGIEPPADLSLGSVLDFVLQVLGISMERIWQKLAEHIGQETVDRIRGAIDRLVGIWTFVRDVQERGVAAIWEYIEGQISGLWDMVLEQAKNWIMERIINRAVQWLLSLLDPTGIMPVINSFMAFFRAVQSAIDYLRDILAIINDYVSTVAAIARGEIQPGADRLEQGLANAIPVAIGFLANQFGLGRIGDKIAEIVEGIRGLVDRALDWLIGRAVSAVQSVLAALGLSPGQEEAPPEPAAEGPASDFEMENWWLEQRTFTDSSGRTHTLQFDGTAQSAQLVVHSDEQVVSDWLVTRREEASPEIRPLVEEALAAFARFSEARGNLETLRAEFEQLPEADQEARRAEYETVYHIFTASLRDLGRTFSALPVEAEPARIVLRLPPQKSSALYQQHVRSGRLQHSRQRPARHTNQLQRWDQHARTEITNEWLDYGRRLGLPDERILRPDWDRRGVRVPMQVDHRVEWQVRPLGDESTLDEPWNYELLDAASNRTSGSAMDANIQAERQRIATETGDHSWLARDLTFTAVEGGGSAGRRWSLEDIANGVHLQVYSQRYGEPATSGALPSVETAAEAQSDEGHVAASTERRTGVESGLRSLERRYPSQGPKLRSIVSMRLQERNWDEIRASLAIGPTELHRLRDLLAGAGIHA
jgi:phage-related protein